MMRTWFVMAITSLSYSCIDTTLNGNSDSGAYTCEGSDKPCEPVILEPMLPRDSCGATAITNMLVGTCWWEQCVKNEKSLYPKIAGVPCVYIPNSINSPWLEGTCDGDGVCSGIIP